MSKTDIYWTIKATTSLQLPNSSLITTYQHQNRLIVIVKPLLESWKLFSTSSDQWNYISIRQITSSVFSPFWLAVSWSGDLLLTTASFFCFSSAPTWSSRSFSVTWLLLSDTVLESVKIGNSILVVRNDLCPELSI